MPERCRALGLEHPCAYRWTKLPLWSTGTLSPPHHCQPLRRDSSHTAQIYPPAPKKRHRNQNRGTCLLTLRPFYSHTLGGTWSIPPHGEPGIPCSTLGCSVLPRIPWLCRGSSVCTHTHTHALIQAHAMTPGPEGLSPPSQESRVRQGWGSPALGQGWGIFWIFPKATRILWGLPGRLDLLQV